MELNEHGRKLIRNRVIQRLEKEGYKNINYNLPLLDNSAFRLKDEVARRIVILFSLKAITVHPEDYNDIVAFLKSKGYDSYMNAEEKLIFDRKTLSKKQEILFSWYSESLYALLWICKMLKCERMDVPCEEISIDKSVLDALPPSVDYNSFRDSIEYIKPSLILEEVYYYYHLHWIAKRKGNILEKLFSKNPKLNFSVILERRKALEWFVDSNNIWEQTPLDT